MQRRLPTFGGGVPWGAWQVGIGTGEGGTIQRQRDAGGCRVEGDLERVVRLLLQGKGVTKALLQDELHPFKR